MAVGNPSNTTKSHYTTNVTQEVYWGKHKRIAVVVKERNNRKLRWEAGLYRVSWDRVVYGGDFQAGDFKSWVWRKLRDGRISTPGIEVGLFTQHFPVLITIDKQSGVEKEGNFFIKLLPICMGGVGEVHGASLIFIVRM